VCVYMCVCFLCVLCEVANVCVCIYIAHVIHSEEGSSVLLLELKTSGSAAGLCLFVCLCVSFMS